MLMERLNTIFLIYCLAGATLCFGLFITTTAIEPSTTLQEDAQVLARLTKDASISAYNFAASLEEGRDGLREAAAGAKEAGSTAQTISEVMKGTTVGETAKLFARQSEQLQTSSKGLNRTSESLAANVRDMQQIGLDLELMTQRLERTSAQRLPSELGIKQILNIMRWSFLWIAAFQVLLAFYLWKP